jgi:multisubunit Na+/H+ antiporter MnhE subunit
MTRAVAGGLHHFAGMLKRALYWLLQWIVLFVLWLWFVDSTAPHELLAGAIAAALGAVGSELARTEARPRFGPHVRWLLQAWRVPGYVLLGCWVLLMKLGRRTFAGDRTAGLFELVPFDAGGDDPPAVARRALAIIFTTLPPNFLIVGIDRQRNLMLFHQVKKDPVPEVTRLLGAKVKENA